mmetsp:Transcript_86539/g.242342  ORF Transcript_86539/g.242342 Transcript_86539/m.242342 type:complete len:655 (+) Transcript_86539:161-2125(+)
MRLQYLLVLSFIASIAAINIQRWNHHWAVHHHLNRSAPGLLARRRSSHAIRGGRRLGRGSHKHRLHKYRGLRGLKTRFASLGDIAPISAATAPIVGQYRRLGLHQQVALTGHDAAFAMAAREARQGSDGKSAGRAPQSPTSPSTRRASRRARAPKHRVGRPKAHGLATPKEKSGRHSKQGFARRQDADVTHPQAAARMHNVSTFGSKLVLRQQENILERVSAVGPGGRITGLEGRPVILAKGPQRHRTPMAPQVGAQRIDDISASSAVPRQRTPMRAQTGAQRRTAPAQHNNGLQLLVAEGMSNVKPGHVIEVREKAANLTKPRLSTKKASGTMPTVESLPELKEWCEKAAYNKSFDYAAFKLNNITHDSKEWPAAVLDEGGGSVDVFHLHTPKVAGVSFGIDLASILPRGLTIDSHEGCFSDVEKPRHGVMMMVRAPRQHVYSQYAFCATSSDNGPRHMQALMPGTFEAWVRSWTALRERQQAFGNFTIGPKTAYNDPWCFSTLPYACYSPIDLQSQRLTCRRAYDYPETIDSDLAIWNMESAFFVGLVEAYQESLCLLHGKVQRSLPEWCDCSDREKWQSAPLHHHSHGVGDASKHGVEDEPDEVLKMVDQLTTSDRLLYKQATKRFVHEVHAVERKFKMKILCKEPAPLPS